MVKRDFLVLCGTSLLVCFLAACGGSDNGNTGAIVTPGTTPTTAPAKHFKVGDTVKVGNVWQIKINNVKSSQGQDFSTPKAGNVFLLIDISLMNISDQEQNVSSALNFTLRDDTGQTITETVTAFTTPPDGKVSAGSPLRGVLAYEVPTRDKSFTLAFEADLLSSGQVVFDLSV